MLWVKQVKHLVQNGIYINSLRDIVEATTRGLETDSRVLVAFTIRQIASSVLDMWEGGRPLQQREHNLVESGLRPPLNALLDALLNDAPREETLDLAESLVKAWQSVQGDLRDLAVLTAN